MIEIKQNTLNLIQHNGEIKFTGDKEHILYPGSDKFSKIKEFIIFGHNSDSLVDNFSYRTLVFVDCFKGLEFTEGVPLSHFIKELLGKHCTLVFISDNFEDCDFSEVQHTLQIIEEKKPSLIKTFFGLANNKEEPIVINIPHKPKYIQDFICHVHPHFCGHEFVEMAYVDAYTNLTKMPVIVTPHFELKEYGTKDNPYNHEFKDREIREKTLSEIEEYSTKNPRIIQGAEFTIQTMLDFESHQIPSEWVIIASYHDMFKYNGYSYKSNGSINMEETMIKRDNHEWYYTGKKTADELLTTLRQVLDNHYIHIIGHLERDIPNMLINPTKEEQEKLLIGTLDLAQEYNVCIEVNYAKTSIEEKKRLIKLAVERDLKLVVGLDAHTNEQINLEYMYEMLDLIPIENQVTLDEIKSRLIHTWS